MATQVEAPAVSRTGVAVDLPAIVRRHFLHETYEEMARRAGVSAEEVEANFRRMYSCGIRAKRLDVRHGQGDSAQPSRRIEHDTRLVDLARICLA